MDYILWVFLLFIGMFAKCLGALLAFALAYYLYQNYADKIIKKLDKTLKGDK